MIDTKNPSVEFNAQDRCDRCPAQALAQADKDGLELLFCGHHINQHKLALEMSGWIVSFDYVGLEKIVPEYKVPVS